MREVFAEYYGALCYYASRILEDRETVEDVVQEIFTQLLEKKMVFESATHLKNHLYLSVKNACLNHLRRNISRERYFEFLKTQEETDPENENTMLEVYRLLAAAVDQLPPECKKVYQLAYFEDLSNEQIAVRLEVSINTVRTHKARGKSLIKSFLEGRLPFWGILVSCWYLL